MIILAINSGGSSFKYRAYQMPEQLELAKGSLERVGSQEAVLKHQKAGREALVRTQSIPGHREAIQAALALLMDPEEGVITDLSELDSIAHKLIHSGPDQVAAKRLGFESLPLLRDGAKLAPLHTQFMVLGVELCLELAPEVAQVGVFETSFHRTLPPKAYTYAFPASWIEKYGLRRFGFHSMSHSYLAERVPELLGGSAQGLRQINCHLGSGSSICAVLSGESVDISSGFSPEAGIPMSTRPGDYDAEALLFAMEQEGLSRLDVIKKLTKESGLLALSGVSDDNRDIRAAAEAGNERAALALEVLAYSVQKYIGAYMATLAGCDVIAFSGGIGENEAGTRAAILAPFGYVGLRLDKAANASGPAERRISAPDSAIEVWVVPTNEEVMVARHAYNLLQSE